MGEFRNLCVKEKMNELGWPSREYIVQIARFDPSKGIPNVIDSYARFRKLLEGKVTEDEIPQLLICGHGAVDDPDASIIYDQVANLVHNKYAEYSKDIVYMRCPPSDQRKCHAVLRTTHLTQPVQCSTRSWRTPSSRCSSRRARASRSRSPRRCTRASP